MSTRNVASTIAKTSRNAGPVGPTKSVPIPATKNRPRVTPVVVKATAAAKPVNVPKQRSAVTQSVAVSAKAKRSTTVSKSAVAKTEGLKRAPSKTKSSAKPVKSEDKPATAKSVQGKNSSKKAAEPVKLKSSAKATLAAPARKMKSVAMPKAPKTKSAAKSPSFPTTETVVRAKRARVPADFAQQYGEKAARKARPAKETAAARKARRNAEEREKLRQLMTPDEELLQRLARLRGEVVLNGNGTAKRKTATVRRSRSWESRCGKCGAAGTYKSAAALCIKCGAITVRVLD